MREYRNEDYTKFSFKKGDKVRLNFDYDEGITGHGMIDVVMKRYDGNKDYKGEDGYYFFPVYDLKHHKDRVHEHWLISLDEEDSTRYGF